MSEVLLKEENLVDLSSINTADNFLFELTNLVEKQNLQGQKIKINFGNVDLSQSNIENMLSVLKAFGIEIEMVYAESTKTKIAAIESGLTVSGQSVGVENKEETVVSENQEISEESELENIISQESNSDSTAQRHTLYIRQTLRSGQKIEHDGNIIIIGDCNAGSEVIATGDIIIWGVLSGIAHAGRDGDKKTCIKAFKINAIQLRIADYLARKPDRLEVEKADKMSFFNPEEAKISEDEIVIYTLQQASN